MLDKFPKKQTPMITIFSANTSDNTSHAIPASATTEY
jgi:hypothetical protein